MSSLVAIQLIDKIYMGSDTAISTNVDGISYRQSNFGKKIYTLDNMLIFCSGNLPFAYMIMNEFSWEEDKTIANLQKIALKYYRIFDLTGERVEIMVGKIFKNCSCIYQISSYNEFNIIKHTNLDSKDIGIWTGGFKTEESYDKTLENLSNKQSIINTYKNVFDTISCEEIGGTLNLYEISKNGIVEILDCDIKEKQDLRVIDSQVNNLHLINAELIRGKLGQFAEVHANQIVVGSNGEKISNDVLDIDLDGVVMQEELYNQVVITQERGIQVLDKAQRERIRLGNYKIGKYGMVIKDKSGSTTVLDEDGILQTWQEGRADNVDIDSPLNLYLYIPQQTNIIHKALLRFKREKFRAYSKATRSKEAVTKSTASGGAFVESTLSGGGTTTDTGASGINVEWVTAKTDYAGEDEHRHSFERVNAHQHAVTIPAHGHYMNIPDHLHSVEIPEHKHDIEYGIYESTLPSNIQIKINDVNYSTYLGAKVGFFNEDRDNIDITPLLKVGQWNTITISSETLGRIDASVFMQAFINTDRKSVILDDRYISSNSLGFGSSFGKSAITGRRINIESGVDYLYRISVNNDIANVYSLRWTGSDYSWVSEFNLGSASNVAISMNGTWIHDDVEMKYKLQTSDYPYLFWVTSGNLYVQKWKDSANKTLLSQNVTKVSSIRGWKNNTFIAQDQGIVCAYIKTDGKVYYRNYCTQADGSVTWELERAVEEFTGTAVNVNLFITNDYRIGFVIEDNLNKTHVLITSQNWAGMSIAPENITVASTKVGVNFIPLEYFNVREEDIITSSVGEVVVDLKYTLTDNKFINIYNQSVVVDDVEDWGKVLIFETKYKLNNLNNGDFEIADNFDRLYSPDTIEEIGDRLFKLTFLEFNNFNNVNTEGTLKFKGLYATNGIDLVYEPFEKVFYPENLVPTEIPLPEVEVVWNE